MIDIPEFEYDYVVFERAETVVANAYTRRATTVTRRKVPIHIRLLRRCVETESSCWEWSGATDKKSGYGKLSSHKQGDMKYTHRVSASWFWLGVTGDAIPTECVGLFGFEFPEPIKAHVHHECRNRRCVNPDHLYWVSAFGNGRLGGTDANSQKTECPHGHGPYDKAYENGWRYCSKCKSEKEKRRRARLKEDGKIVLKGNYESNKTHCSRGHEYNEENTKLDSNGWRKCKVCIRINNQNRSLSVEERQ